MRIFGNLHRAVSKAISGGKSRPSDATEDSFLYDGVWTAIVSSNVAYAHYDVNDAVLTVEFHNEARYEYYGVTEDMARDFLRASSAGIWVDRNLKKAKVPFRKIRSGNRTKR
jgi:hypothetical protein